MRRAWRLVSFYTTGNGEERPVLVSFARYHLNRDGSYVKDQYGGCVYDAELVGQIAPDDLRRALRGLLTLKRRPLG
jgi:hypothetical protein